MIDYREMEGINQSSLKEILKHPTNYKLAVERQKEEVDILGKEEHFIIGTLVDLLQYDPKKLEEKYTFVDLPTLSDVLKNISHAIIEESDLEEIDTFNPEDVFFKRIVLNAANNYNYYNNRKDETRIAGILDSCLGYLTIMRQNKGKTILSTIYKNKAQTIAAILNSDAITAKYFQKSTDKVENIFHPVYQFEYKDILIKCELDQVIINHDLQFILPIDLKTIGKPIYTFNSQFWQRRYDFQAIVYNKALESQSFVKKLLEKGYKLLNFTFIVVESNTLRSPLVYKVPQEVMDIGLNGGMKSTGFKLEGLNQAIERFKFHQKEDKWEYPMEYYTNNHLLIEK